MQQGYVYKITSPTNKIYIGSTVNIKRRIYLYKVLHCKNQTKLYNSLKKYGFDNHKFEIIWKGELENMLKNESLLGLKFNVLDKSRGLNCKLPKLNDGICSYSSETIKKMSNSRKGVKLSQETKNKIGLANKNRVWAQLSKDKISRSKKGIKRPKHVIELLKNKDKKFIIQMDLNGNFIKEWFGVYTTARELNLNPSALANCCRGDTLTCGKFKWKYK